MEVVETMRYGRGTASLAAVLIVLAHAPSTAGASDSATCDARTVAVQSGVTIAGTYCRPAAAMSQAMFVLVPGATYNRAYWDFQYQPATYSFTRALVGAGYAVFAIDRLGTGESSKLPSASLTATLDAATVHDVVGYLHSTGFAGQSFSKVLLGGHSLGSTISIIEAATYHDVDGLLLTGIAHRIDAAFVAQLFALDFHPAPLDPALASRGLDPGYLTTVPGHRYHAFHAPGQIDPGVLAQDEATKDVFSPTETTDGIGVAILAPYSVQIDVPVLIVNGDQDTIFCGTLAADCSSRAAFLAQERPQYASAPCVDAMLMPGVGHDVNLHPSAKTYQAGVIHWAASVVDGGCPG
jgi:pimeloyl-ACP methyl ester carboxylesterase